MKATAATLILNNLGVADVMKVMMMMMMVKVKVMVMTG